MGWLDEFLVRKVKKKQTVTETSDVIFNNILYNNILAELIERYDYDEMVISIESLLLDILRKNGLDDKLDDFINFMPSHFRDELKTMYDDNN